MALYVRFWGTRGSIPTPGPTTRRYGGNTSCYEVRTDDATFILDAGTGIRELGLDLMQRHPDGVEAHLLFSHAHWDHIQGFPFFVPAYQPNNRFYVYDRDGGGSHFFDLLSGQMDSDYFPVDFSDLGAKIDKRLIEMSGETLAGVHVSVFEQMHPGGSYAYRLEHDGASVVYATDNEIDLLLLDKAQPTKDPDGLRALPDELVAFCQGADLLIADAQYSDEEYRTREGWGHPRASTVVDLAVQAGVKRVALTHHDPMHSDTHVDAKVATCLERARAHGVPGLEIFGAREGVELKL